MSGERGIPGRRPLVLGLETAGRLASVALLRGDDVLALRSSPGPHSGVLMPMVSEVLASQEIGPSSLDVIGVASGPGAYTGLRVGVVSGKVLAWAVGACLVGVPTLEAMAAAAPTGASRVLVALHAYKRRLTIAWYDRDESGALELAGEPTLVKAEASPKAGAGEAVVTDAPELLPGLDGWEATVVPFDGAALQVARIALTRWRAGAEDESRSLTPTYLRPPSITLSSRHPVSRGASTRPTGRGVNQS